MEGSKKVYNANKTQLPIQKWVSEPVFGSISGDPKKNFKLFIA